MLKKLIKRVGFGFILGIAVGDIIAALTGFPDRIVSSQLVQSVGGLSLAFIIESLCSGFLGAVSMGGTVLYELERWPLMWIAIAHYALIQAVYIPTGFLLSWFSSLKEALVWAGINAAAYILVFLIMCAIYRSEVRRLNELNEKRKEQNEQNTGGAK